MKSQKLGNPVVAKTCKPFGAFTLVNRIIILLLVLLAGFFGCVPAGDYSSTADVYFKGLKSTDEFVAFRVPVRMAYLAVPKHEKEARQLLKEVHSIGLVVLPKGHGAAENLLLGAALQKSLSRNGYSDMLTIVQSSQKIHVNVLEREGRIREMVMIVASEEDFVFIKIKGSISVQNFANFVNKHQSTV